MVTEQAGPFPHASIQLDDLLVALLIGRTDPFSLTPMPKTVLTKPYDWTYTTTYPGHFDQDDSNPASTSLSCLWKPADPENPSNVIPLAELSRQDPILFYAEVPLFEDELHDNGASSLIVRIVGILFILFLPHKLIDK
jgi:type 2A phosphatase activator TIP41